MKKQTYIAIIRDDAGKAITFERFTCKKTDTVKKHMQQLFTNELYRICIGDAATIDIYATPDGYTRDATPAATMAI